MPEPLEVRFAPLAQGTQELSLTGDSFLKLLRAFVDAVKYDPSNPPWGTTPDGEQFEKGYVAAAVATRDAVGEVASTVEEIANRTHEARIRFQHTQDEALENIGNSRRRT
ncbi:hypothetical protein ACIO8H_35535 [Streptomyces sp. NPDC087226]|jgi:hypothetical protein|uniref:hypothetical protein n=1 Tax=Streptomyces sp. NPDC087226 TaxID=3365771 RepID=UPI0037F3FBF3